MKRYLEHVKKKDPHERRAHALRIAGTVTAIVFVGWLATLGARLATTGSEVVRESDISQTASVLLGIPLPSGGLQVSPEGYTGY